MLHVESGERSARVVALQILLNRSAAVVPKLVTDGEFGDRTRTAVDLYRDAEMRQSGPAGVADPALWRFMLDRARLAVMDSVDVTDPMLLDRTVPELTRWTSPVTLGAMSNGVHELVTKVKERVQDQGSLLMLRLHGHGKSGIVAVSHGSRRIMGDKINPFEAQSVIAHDIVPVLEPQLRRLAPLFCDFGFVELHSCHVAEGVEGQGFVRKLAEILGVPVRAAYTTQSERAVFTLTGPTLSGLPGGRSLREWGLSRKEGVKPGLPGPPPPPKASATQARDRTTMRRG